MSHNSNLYFVPIKTYLKDNNIISFSVFVFVFVISSHNTLIILIKGSHSIWVSGTIVLSFEANHEAQNLLVLVICIHTITFRTPFIEHLSTAQHHAPVHENMHRCAKVEPNNY